MKKNGQFPNVRVEYGFGAVCQATNCGDMIDAPKWATSVFPWQVEQS